MLVCVCVCVCLSVCPGVGVRPSPTPTPPPAYRTVCSVNGPLVVLDQVKVRPLSLPRHHGQIPELPAPILISSKLPCPSVTPMLPPPSS